MKQLIAFITITLTGLTFASYGAAAAGVEGVRQEVSISLADLAQGTFKIAEDITGRSHFDGYFFDKDLTDFPMLNDLRTFAPAIVEEVLTREGRAPYSKFHVTIPLADEHVDAVKRLCTPEAYWKEGEAPDDAAIPMTDILANPWFKFAYRLAFELNTLFTKSEQCEIMGSMLECEHELNPHRFFRGITYYFTQLFGTHNELKSMLSLNESTTEDKAPDDMKDSGSAAKAPCASKEDGKVSAAAPTHAGEVVE